ncbi:hypothetical protein Hrd1104_02860 [Halorhabdus sp. CBA1104]|uniref:DUF5787 family protein n=1 Tax=Halorhabdus sp. CBA1104 TaxID=1380432 RepID=UPI0012B21C01|nr:DUF5787 family protein [Halorhabdus sp. CBA1104]QGN06337.1 hypothetical protein Hrd1104_02860 [Halorhabdus sp. CBA1104]
MREYAFELALCGAIEDEETLVARQLGAHVQGRRIIDVVAIEPGPAVDRRAAITDGTIPSAAIEAPVGPGTARALRDVFPDRRPEQRGRLVERAVQAGFFERERVGGDPAVRQVCRYPERWFDRLVGIENKPDLDRPGDLQGQLQTDVSLGIFDAVVLATASHVTGAHRNRIPEEVGIWQFDPESGERDVLRDPTSLATDRTGIEILDRMPGQTDIRTVSPSEKARARRRLAERAYGKGWRTFDYPGCTRCVPGDGPTETAPYCEWAGRIVDPASECGPDCRGYESGECPPVDLTARRANASPWRPDPEGRTRRQAGLDRYE